MEEWRSVIRRQRKIYCENNVDICQNSLLIYKDVNHINSKIIREAFLFNRFNTTRQQKRYTLFEFELQD